MKNRKALAISTLAFCCALGLEAQSAAPLAPTADLTESGGSGNLGFEPVGPGDLVSISVTGAPELSRSSRVTEEGKIVLPLLTAGVPVAGLRPAQIAEAVRAALVKGKVLVDPIVSAAVLEYRSRRVSVVGAVHMPANFQAVGEMHLLDAIARAQGFSADAGPEVIVSFPADRAGEKAPLHVPLKALLAAKDPALNIVLHGGEEIRVPEAPKLFIVGNVKMPGSYPLPDPDGSTVMKALALSQGALPYTARHAYVYRLIASSGKRQEIPVDLREILHRKAPDVPLEANDILYIPGNAGMRLTATTLEHMAGFGSAVGSGLIVWH